MTDNAACCVEINSGDGSGIDASPLEAREAKMPIRTATVTSPADKEGK
jgi:hypothetical protein